MAIRFRFLGPVKDGGKIGHSYVFTHVDFYTWQIPVFSIWHVRPVMWKVTWGERTGIWSPRWGLRYLGICEKVKDRTATRHRTYWIVKYLFVHSQVRGVNRTRLSHWFRAYCGNWGTYLRHKDYVGYLEILRILRTCETFLNIVMALLRDFPLLYLLSLNGMPM